MRKSHRYLLKFWLSTVLYFFTASVFGQLGEAPDPCGEGKNDLPFADCDGPSQDSLTGEWNCPPPEPCDPNDPLCALIDIIGAFDPNDIIGNSGYDSLQWVSDEVRLTYTIRFENDPNFATGPARDVDVELFFHENLSPNSLRIESYGFGNFYREIPNNQFYVTEVVEDFEDELGVHVGFNAGLDVTNNRIFANFRSIDPVTGSTPSDPFVGFLPVNDTTQVVGADSIPRNGEGFMSFSVKMKNSVQTGDDVLAQASIVFDDNPPIATNIWENRIDAFPPLSAVEAVEELAIETAELMIFGEDDAGGVGVANYDLYVSKDGGPYYEEASNLTFELYEFHGDSGSYYNFYSLASDFVGNMEEPPLEADATVYFGASLCDFEENLPLVADGVLVSDSLACSGTELTLTVSGGNSGAEGTWVWYEGGCGDFEVSEGDNVLIIPTQDVTYFVKAIGECGETECVQVNIDVLTAPEPPILNLSDTIQLCENAILLCEVNQDSISWNNGVENSDCIEITEVGVYFGIATNECGETFSENVTVDICDQVDELAEAGISFFPNPVVDDLTIVSEEAVTLELFSSSGKLVLSEILPSGRSVLNLERFAQGNYTIKFQFRKKSIQRNLIRSN